ncbi:hypothetical protein PCASD_24648 [Puccinia coronata f. sp. avenae]|uniref:Lysophospholipase n=1 Tax=Puccinia coronata f. sp. avenae TaxID=200324 RepID=A0A2N5S9S9_9BASI|nr:hypothetical protein PCASD_24648 [Puccinia coronata f. sp. avenae]
MLVQSRLASPSSSAKTTAAPFKVACPTDRQLLRMTGAAAQGSQTLAQEEQYFRQGRQAATSSSWKAFFTNGPGSATGYQNTLLMAPTYTDWPILGIAHSGGGERATLYAAGVLQALDARTTSSPLRGIYQLATYATGLSGGSWLVIAMAANNYPTIPDLFNKIKMDRDLILSGGTILGSMKYFQNILKFVLEKKIAGFQTSMIDYWSVALGQHFLPELSSGSMDFFSGAPGTATPRGAGLTFSSFRDTPAVRRFQNPLPIIVSNHQPVVEGNVNPNQLPIQGVTQIPLSATIYETSPFEFGSFDPQLSAFTPTEFLGTSLESGKPVNAARSSTSFLSNSKNSCVRGFDQMSFVMGTSAARLKVVFQGVIPGFPAIYTSVIKYFFPNTEGDDPLVAHYPNPFKGVNGNMGFDRSASNELLIVDGGENGENIPFNPLLAPGRQVDVILAADASADTDAKHVYGDNWPNGASLINTWLRTHQVLPTGAANFPPVPLQPQVWMDQGFNTRPSFFGCDAPINRGNGGYPLVIYLPNSPLSPSPTNTSTFQMKYSAAEQQQFLSSVMSSTTSPRFGAQRRTDPEWPTCISCALIERSRNRANVPRSTACQRCFMRYCYQDGVAQQYPN